jgi:hypothetical protein
MRTLLDSSDAARSQVAHTVFTASSVCAETSYVKPQCAVMYQAWLSQAGNGDERL